MAKAPPKRTRIDSLHTKLRRNGEWDRLMAVWPTNIKSVRKSDLFALQPEETVAEEAWRVTLADNAKLTPEEKRLLERNPPPLPKTGDGPRAVIQSSAEDRAKEECRKIAKGKKASRIEAFLWAEQHKSEPWSAIDRSTVPSIAAFEYLQSFKGPDGNSEYLKHSTALLHKDIKRETDKEKHGDDDRSLIELHQKVARRHIESEGTMPTVKVLQVECEDCGAPVQVRINAIGPVALLAEDDEREIQVA